MIVCRTVQANHVLLFLRLRLGSKNDLANVLQRELTSVARLYARIQRSPKLQKQAEKIFSKLILQSGQVLLFMQS